MIGRVFFVCVTLPVVSFHSGVREGYTLIELIAV